jgi:hypothetical protein
VIGHGSLGIPVGGSGFEQAPEPPSSEALAATWRPYVDTCVEAFGAGADEKANLFEHTAGRFYRLQGIGAG